MADVRRSNQNREVKKGLTVVKLEPATRDPDEVRRRMTRDHDSKTDNISKKNV